MLFVVRPKRSTPSNASPRSSSGASASSNRVWWRSSRLTWKSVKPSRSLNGSVDPGYRRLADEEHLRVLRQRPEIVGDDLLQLVRRLAGPGHRGDLPVPGMDREVHPLDPLRVLVR